MYIYNMYENEILIRAPLFFTYPTLERGGYPSIWSSDSLTNLSIQTGVYSGGGGVKNKEKITKEKEGEIL